MASGRALRIDPDRWALALLVLAAVVLAGWRWLDDHPQHNPWAPLALRQPEGWATRAKLLRLREDRAECRAFLTRSRVPFTDLPPVGAAECRRADRMTIAAGLENGLIPARPQASCAVHSALVYWLHHDVQPAARELMGAEVAAIQHLGTNNCRRIGGGSRWSEHATGNAIDIAAFVLADGTRITVLRDWSGEGVKSAFLRRVRDGACSRFATVLSPDYNAAHADHFHLDQANRQWSGGFCR